MKTLLLALVAGSAVLPVQAQLFGPESLGGAVLGGIAGGVIGHNNGRRTAEGIAIGAGAGLLLGTLADQAARPVPPPAPVVYAAPDTVFVSTPPPHYHGPQHRHFGPPPPPVRWVRTVFVAAPAAAPAVQDAPVASVAPVAFEPSAAGSFAPANALFGR